MPQRTDLFDIGRLGLTSGEGRRLDLHVHDRPVRLRRLDATPCEPELVPVRLDVSRTTGNGWALRLRFDARRSTARACAAWSPRRRRFEVDSYEVHQPGAGDEELISPYMAEDELDLEALGARRARARPADPDHLPRRLRRPVRAVRREPQRGPGPRARAGARPALGEALRAEVRLGARSIALADSNGCEPARPAACSVVAMYDVHEHGGAQARHLFAGASSSGSAAPSCCSAPARC